MNKLYLVALLFFYLLSIPISASFEEIYQNAYLFARSPQGLNFTYGQAYAWAKKFVEDKAIPDQKNLVNQYQEAFDFAISSNGLRLSLRESDLWAKSFVQKKFYISSTQKISTELNIFLREVSFSEEEARQWGKDFFSISSPIYFDAEILSVYEDVYNFCRTHYLFQENHDTARNVAKKFIQKRFIFDQKRIIFDQYVLAFNFAHSSRGLGFEFESAQKWAQNYIEERGTFNPSLGLAEQYQEAYIFARSSNGLKLDDNSSISWSRNFMKRRAYFSNEQSLFGKYQEAYIFAYNGEVLSIVYQMRDTPQVFLADEAFVYAKNLIQTRAQINPQQNLLRQFEDAVIFAYASDGLQLDYYEARNWAKKFIEYTFIY